MRGGLLVACLLVSVATAHAQKPLGLFDPGPNHPTWASVGTISDTVSDDAFRDAAALSQSRPFVWLLQLGYHEDPRTPIGPHAARIRARLEATGLLPYVVALSVGEEWYEYWLAGEFARYGLTADNPAGQPMIHDWLGKQHAAAKAQIPVAVVWITTVAGNATYRPVPANTDIVALDPYIPVGGSFHTSVAPILDFAEQAIPHPLVLVPQWFEAPGFAPVNETTAALYALRLSRPRYIAMLGFTWRDRPQLSMKGLESLPALRLAVEKALRVPQ